MKQVQEREYSFDVFRVILCILVVIGHATYMNVDTPFGGIQYRTMMDIAGIKDTAFHSYMMKLTKFIYTFHMPAFFVLSGYFFGKNEIHNSVFQIIKKKFINLILPCVLIWLVWNIPIKWLAGYYEGIPILKVMLQIVFPNNVYLWFLETLFVCCILARILNTISSARTKWIMVIIMFVGGEIITGKNLLTNWSLLGNPLKYILWFEVGISLPSIIDELKKLRVWRLSGGIIGLFVYLLTYIGYLNVCGKLRV